MDRRRRAARTVALMSLFTMTDTQTDVPIASFDGDGSDLISLIVGIDPVQDLNGYDNPWPAGGGKNIVNLDNHNVSPSDSATILFDGLYNLQAGTYTLSWTLNKTITATRNRASYSIGSSYYYADSDSKTAGRHSWTFTLAEAASLRFGWWANAVSENCTISDFQLELGSTATSYAPYSNICPISGWTGANIHVSPTTDAADGTTYPIPLGTTVYGATIDVVNGKVYARPYYPSYNGETLVGPWISSMDKYEEGATPTTGAQVVDMGGTVTEISLTPTQVTTLIGTNNIWADTGDIKYIEYNI